MKHVATPWCVETPMDEEYAIVQSGLEAYEWQFIAVCPVTAPAEGGFPRQRAEANAAFIVKACNSHDALVKALTAMVDRWEPDCSGTDRTMWEEARAALQEAGR